MVRPQGLDDFFVCELSSWLGTRDAWSLATTCRTFVVRAKEMAPIRGRIADHLQLRSIYGAMEKEWSRIGRGKPTHTAKHTCLSFDDEHVEEASKEIIADMNILHLTDPDAMLECLRSLDLKPHIVARLLFEHTCKYSHVSKHVTSSDTTREYAMLCAKFIHERDAYLYVHKTHLETLISNQDSLSNESDRLRFYEELAFKNHLLIHFHPNPNEDFLVKCVEHDAHALSSISREMITPRIVASVSAWNNALTRSLLTNWWGDCVKLIPVEALENVIRDDPHLFGRCVSTRPQERKRFLRVCIDTHPVKDAANAILSYTELTDSEQVYAMLKDWRYIKYIPKSYQSAWAVCVAIASNPNALAWAGLLGVPEDCIVHAVRAVPSLASKIPEYEWNEGLALHLVATLNGNIRFFPAKWRTPAVRKAAHMHKILHRKTE